MGNYKQDAYAYYGVVPADIELVERIINGAADYADEDYPMDRCCKAYCKDNNIPMEYAEKAFRLDWERQALRHGIPLAVVRGKAKLRDHGVPPDEDCGYELDDPKHPTYHDRMLELADAIRKQRLEDT